MKKIVLIALLAQTALASAAYSVKGTVADARDTAPLPGALCRLTAVGDTAKILLQTITDADGAFIAELPAPGQYVLRAEYMGYAPSATEFVAAKADVDLGMIYLTEDATTLQAVTVTGRRPVIQANGERVTYNMQEDPESQTSTVLDMLRKVPMVTVDGQDNIQVNGQSQFKILVNGKENPMFSSNAKDILKVLPAAMVKKIEVITEPGAKYDAEGVGGILNIVTETAAADAVEKYTVTLRGEIDNTDGGGSVNALTSIGRVTASLNYNYNRSFNPREQDARIERTILGDNPIQTIMEGTQTNRHTMHNGSFDLSWEPSEKNLFNLNASLMLGSGSMPFDMVQTTLDGHGQELSRMLQHQRTHWNWGNWSTSASYQHNFDKEGRDIVASYLYSHGVNKTESHIGTADALSPADILWQNNSTRNPTNEHTLQLDYTNPLDDHHKLETGAKAIFRRNSSDGLTSGDAPAQDVSLKQYQDVAALYASYSGTYGNWSTKAGLRYEFTHMGVDFLTGGERDFSTDLNDVVPNAALAYNFTPMSSLRLAYQMRISRPTVSQLNPYRDDSSPLAVEYGNPDLTSERSNNITLTYSRFGGPVGMNLSASYFLTNNTIGQYSYTEGGKIYTTYDNTGRNQSLGLNAYLMFTLSRKFSLTLNGGVNYKDFKYAEMHLANHGWDWNTFANVNYTLPAAIRLTAYGGAMRRGKGLQSGGMNTISFYSLSLAKSFLDDRLTLTASASNFFGKLKVRFDSWTADSFTRLSADVPLSSFGVSLSYRIGGGVKDVKKVSTKIDNDDLQKTSGGTTLSGN